MANVRLVIAALSIVLTLPSFGYAQATTGTVSGTVKDASDAVLPGATVTATNLETQITRTTVAEGDGRYSLPTLSVGTYEIRAELPGFSEAVRSGIVLTVGRHAVVDFVMEVGEVSTDITVKGEAALVETANAQIGGLVDEKAIRDLPLNSRSYTDLALFQTGVHLSRATGKGGMVQAGFGTMMTVSGARPEHNAYRMDGTDVSDVYQRGTGSVTQTAMGVEAIREFVVLTHNYGAEQGKHSGGIVNVVTRSGTNDMHGSAFEFLRHSAFDARNFFDQLGQPDFMRNQFGFSLGGPIIRARTFYFGTYEGLREELGTTEIARVPTAAARSGLLQNPTTRQFTQIQIKPAVLPFLALYPLPTPGGRDFFDGSAEFTAQVTRPASQDYYAGRVDHQLTADDSLFVRYTFTEGDVQNPRAPFNELFAGDIFNRNQYLTIGNTHVFTTKLLGVARFGYSRTQIGEANITLNPAAADPALFMVPGGALREGSGGRMPALTIGGLASLGPEDGVPRTFTKNLFEGTYEISYSAGNHWLKTGAQIQVERLNAFEQTRMGGRWSLPNLRAFLEGTPASSFQVAPPEFSDPDRKFRQKYGGFFFQDDFRVSSQLTLNLGVRAELTSALTEADGKMSFLPEDLFRTGSNADMVVGENWYESPGVAWAPRFGFAWVPSTSGKSVLRGGAGVYYDHIQPWWYLIMAWRNFPHYNVIAANVLPDGRPLPFPLTVGEIINIFGSAANQVGQFQREPDQMRSYHYNLNWQQQLTDDLVVKIGYVGSRVNNMGTLAAYNQADPIGTNANGSPIFGPTPHVRPNRRYEVMERLLTEAEAWYDGVTLEVNKRLSKGLRFQGSYTFSKMLDTKGGMRTGGGDPEGSVRRDFPETLKGLAPFHVPHNFTLNASYELPSPGGTGIVGILAGGWQVNGLLSLAAGHPFTVTQRAAAADLKLLSRPNLVPGRDMRNDVVLGGPNQYLDPTAFSFSDPTTLGDVGRYTLLGPGMTVLDLSVNKNVRLQRLPAGSVIQLRLEFFNVLNRANFGPPSTFVFDALGRVDQAVGRITTTTSAARQMQLGVRFIF